MAAIRKMLDQEPSEVELLLPWHAAGTLNARDARRVDEALSGDPELARQYVVIREEYAETIQLNENLGAPSMRAMQKLFADIDQEPVRTPSNSVSLSTRIAQFFASLSPRTLAWSAGLGAFVLLLQAGVIGAVLMTKNQNGSFQTASLMLEQQRAAAPELRSAAPITRNLGAAAAPRALVRFAPDARISDITALLDNYQASIVGGAREGMFRIQFGNSAMSKDDVAALLGRLQKEKIVSLAVETP
jgi:type II secretory pathway component PulM